MGTIAVLLLLLLAYFFSATGAIVLIVVAISTKDKRLEKQRENSVVKAVVVDETPITRRQAENTGYSVGYGRRITASEHYRYRNVIVGYMVTFEVERQNGKKDIVKCRKDSATYKRLIAIPQE